MRSESRVEVRDLDEPEVVVDHPLGVSRQVRLAGTVVTRHVLKPGWSWVEHERPVVGTPSCRPYHRGVVLSGRMGVRTDEGEELVIEPNHMFDLPPGHATWVEGDDELVMVDWAGGAGFDPRPGGESRVLATVLFTDIVDSTTLAREAGDAAWERTIGMHDDVVRNVIVGFGGREVETAGDSLLVVFRQRRAGHPLRTGAARGRRRDPPVDPRGHPQWRGGDERRHRARAGRAHRGSHHGSGRSGRGARVGHDSRPRGRRDGLMFESRGRHRLEGLEREHELFAAASSACRHRDLAT